eukprot:Amastigsp_a509154_44.p4 type:complete len:108 gc:universal Amastigsp_a509154_44:399-722(+)
MATTSFMWIASLASTKRPLASGRSSASTWARATSRTSTKHHERSINAGYLPSSTSLNIAFEVLTPSPGSGPMIRNGLMVTSRNTDAPAAARSSTNAHAAFSARTLLA